MKKLLIASVSILALAAGSAVAQTPGNTSDLTQTGASNSAAIDQTAAGVANSNTSTVNQGGWGAAPNSGNGYGATNSSVSVTQVGDYYNWGSVISSDIQQNDDSQSATVKQTAYGLSNLTSTINQRNQSNTASVTQKDVVAHSTQTSTVNQSGQYGLATVSQQGYNDTSTIKQTGNGDNDSTYRYNPSSGTYVYGGVSVDQSGGGQNTSIVNQYSDNSGVAVAQNGGSGENSSIVEQSGAGHNFAYVSQTSGSSVLNTAVTTQVGSGNLASVAQR